MSNLLQHPLTLELGSWLLHFSWQAVVLAGFLWMLLRLLKNSRPEVRYLACWFTVGLMLLLPTLTVKAPAYLDVHQFIPWKATEAASTLAPVTTHAAATTSTLTTTPSRDTLLNQMLSLRGYLVILWMLGVIGYGLKLQSGIRRLSHIKFSGIPADGTLIDKLQSLCEKMGIRVNVRLMVSHRIDQPLLMGWLKPVILLPAGFLTGLPMDQLEAILAHELAHVRRHDYFFSVLQSVLETLFFYHPVIWWISKQIRNEREYCCDALAVDTLRNRKMYLNTLSNLEMYRLALQVQPASPGVVLSMQDGSLLDRAKRIANHSPNTPSNINMKTKSLLMGTALSLGQLVFMAAGIYKPSTAQEKPDINTTVESEVHLHNEINNNLEVNVGPVINLNVEVNVAPDIEIAPLDKPSLHPLMKKTKVSSGYGMRMHPVLKVKRLHQGIDFPVQVGMAVYATADGTIKTVAEDNAYGKLIVITHSDGYETWYSSLSAFEIKQGDVVKAGDKIGESGNSGMSTAPHLHYEVRLRGEAVDPSDYLPAE